MADINDNRSVGKLVRFGADEVIIREGEVNLEMYKIIQGKVVICTGYGTDKEVVIRIIGEQSCFGEYGLLIEKPSIYTVVAYTDVYVMRVAEGDMGEFVMENHRNIIDIMRNMANTMNVMRMHIDMLTKDIEEGRKPEPETVEVSKRLAKGYVPYSAMDMQGRMRYINAYRDNQISRFVNPAKSR